MKATSKIYLIVSCYVIGFTAAGVLIAARRQGFLGPIVVIHSYEWFEIENGRIIERRSDSVGIRWRGHYEADSTFHSLQDAEKRAEELRQNIRNQK